MLKKISKKYYVLFAIILFVVFAVLFFCAINKSDEPQIDENIKISSLSYEMKELYYEAITSDGIKFQTDRIIYPYFYGNSKLEKLLNSRYEDMVNEFKKNSERTQEETDIVYEEFYSEISDGFLPFTDEFNVEIKYNKNGYFSFKEEDTNFHGGAHPYSEGSGYIYKINTAKAVSYNDLIDGSNEDDHEVLLYHLLLNDTMYYGIEDIEKSECVLDKDGLTFYINIGDAVGREIFTVPYTDTDSPVISSDKILYPDFGEELNDEKAKKLWQVANLQYCLWVYWREDRGYANRNRTVDLNGDGYDYLLIEHSVIDSKDKLRRHLSEYFGEKICDEVLNSPYSGYEDYNGELYSRLLEIGGSFTNVEDIYLKEQNGNNAIITMVTSDFYFDENSYTDMYVSYVDGKWIFVDEYFNCCY